MCISYIINLLEFHINSKVIRHFMTSNQFKCGSSRLNFRLKKAFQIEIVIQIS